MRRAGFFFRATLALSLFAFSACDHDGPSLSRSDEKGPREIVLGTDTMKLPDSVHVATVRMDRSKRAEITPAQVTVRTGDLVRFIASDAGAHAIAFDGETLEQGAREFLDRTGQMRSPPFVESGSTWVVSFKDAPPGKYSYRCPTHGVQGEVTVTAR
jgi:plastocyanin